jgi:hypothetical protein
MERKSHREIPVARAANLQRTREQEAAKLRVRAGIDPLLRAKACFGFVSAVPPSCPTDAPFGGVPPIPRTIGTPWATLWQGCGLAMAFRLHHQLRRPS